MESAVLKIMKRKYISEKNVNFSNWTKNVYIHIAGMYLVFDFERGNQYLRKGDKGLFTEEGAFYTNAIYHFDK